MNDKQDLTDRVYKQLQAEERPAVREPKPKPTLGDWLAGFVAYAVVVSFFLLAVAWAVTLVSSTVASMTIEEIAVWFIPVNVFLACTLQHLRPIDAG